MNTLWAESLSTLRLPDSPLSPNALGHKRTETTTLFKHLVLTVEFPGLILSTHPLSTPYSTRPLGSRTRLLTPSPTFFGDEGLSSLGPNPDLTHPVPDTNSSPSDVRSALRNV